MDEAGSVEPLKGEHGYRSYAADFEDQVHLFVSAAKLGWVPANEERVSAEIRSLNDFKRLMLVFESELRSSFAEEDYKRPSEALQNRTRNQCVFIHLYNTVLKLQEASIKENRVGILALSAKVREWALNFLGENGFFKRPNEDIIREYIEIEPQIVALAQLCSMNIIPIDQGVEEARAKVKSIGHEILRQMKPG